MIPRVLLLATSPELRRGLLRLFEGTDWCWEAWDQTADPQGFVRTRPVDLIVLEAGAVAVPEAFIGFVQSLPGAPDVLLLRDGEDPEADARAAAAGAVGVLSSRVAPDAMRDVAEAILSRRSQIVNRELAGRRILERPKLGDFLSSSPAMRAFMRIVARVAASDASLLLLGETGVGKERLARAIHADGPRADGPFVAINCGALPETLLESELFGHRVGAFTGAVRARRGMFELAHEGTLLLDEIGDLPLHLQVKLLRVLEDRTIRPLGSERDLRVDVRILAATNHDLQRRVEDGSFREDLYYRLSVVTLEIPPLRERREDIPGLVSSYVRYLRGRVGSTVTGIDEEALERLVAYPWPGNVRELINVVERALLLSEGECLRLEDLPSSIRGDARFPARAEPRGPGHAEPGQGDPSPIADPAEVEVAPARNLHLSLREVRSLCEKAYLHALLRSTEGRVAETARRAGLSPRVLYDYMRRYGLRKETFKRG